MNRYVKALALLVRDSRHLPKTLYFNFRYFPFKTALRLPVMVSANVKLLRMKGRIELNGPVRHRMVRLGFGSIGIFDRARARSIWEVNGGVVQFNGRADIGHGSKVCVLGGHLTFGDNFTITAESQIVCARSVTFGNDCLLSWQILVMDTDFHKLYDQTGDQLNEDRPIRIGHKNWIGCRAMILKGARTADNCVIAAGSTVTRHVPQGDAVLAGSPVSVVRTEIGWVK